MKKSLIPNDERIYNRPDKDGNYPSIKDFFNAGLENKSPDVFEATKELIDCDDCEFNPHNGRCNCLQSMDGGYN